MTWLITGGAGYIGAHVARVMAGDGERAVVLDDLSTGRAARVPADVPLVHGSVRDRALLDRTLAEHGVTGVVHLAARKDVGESVAHPLAYYRENVTGLVTLLEAAAAAGVARFVFSSSAAVYGTPDTGADGLVTEETPGRPLSPYGETKLAGEWLVRSAGRAHGMATACLRYFNVAGSAEPALADTGTGNVLPRFFARLSRGEPVRVFGDDYPTPDGSCVRDYVHVVDLAEAHLAAARHLARPGAAAAGDVTVNVGTGRGVSVRELAALVAPLVAESTGRPAPPPEVVARRPGDPARVVAAVRRAEEVLGFVARRDIAEMVASAWRGWSAQVAARTAGTEETAGHST